MSDIQTIHFRDLDGMTLFEATVGPKPGQPNVLFIYDIVRFSGGNEGVPMQWKEMTDGQRALATKAINEQYRS